MENDLSLSNKPTVEGVEKESTGKVKSGSLSVRELVSNRQESFISTEHSVAVTKSDDITDRCVPNDTAAGVTEVANGPVVQEVQAEVDDKGVHSVQACPSEPQNFTKETAEAGKKDVADGSTPSLESHTAEQVGNQVEDASGSPVKKYEKNASSRSVATLDPMGTTGGHGVPLSDIPHITEFIELNKKNDTFLKMVRRFLYGTIGSQRSRHQDILTFNGLPSGHLSEEDLANSTNDNVLFERVKKLTPASFKVLCDLFNVPQEEEKIHLAADSLVAFVMNPVQITESVVKPYVIFEEADALKTPTSLRKSTVSRQSPAEGADETPSKRVSRRGRPRKNMAEDSDEEDDEFAECISSDAPGSASKRGKRNAHAAGNDAEGTPSKRAVKRTVTVATNSVTVVNENGTTTDGVTPVKRGRGRPPKVAKTPQSGGTEGKAESYTPARRGRSSIVHSVE